MLYSCTLSGSGLLRNSEARFTPCLRAVQGLQFSGFTTFDGVAGDVVRSGCSGSGGNEFPARPVLAIARLKIAALTVSIPGHFDNKVIGDLIPASRKFEAIDAIGDVPGWYCKVLPIELNDLFVVVRVKARPRK